MSDPVRIHGLPDLLKKLDAGLGVPEAAAGLLDRWRFFVERRAKGNIKRGSGGWLWHGGTRRSITSERDQSHFPTSARAGSNLDTARWGEFGTGLLSEDPESAGRRYFPPPQALEPWARAHNWNPYLLARHIYQKGGTEPRRFLRNAADEAERQIPGWLGGMARDIERTAGRAAD